MTIEDLKTLMDEFDPAALLPELDTIVGKVELVARIAVMAGPIILLILGLAYLLVSPKEANYHFGYRCYFGMGSVNAWRFSQRLAGIVWGLLGLILTAVMLLICSSFRGQEIMDILSSAVKCVVWQAVAAAVSCLVINLCVATRYDAKGELRAKN
ncbi:MAG: SdpI family protein [Oscillospiraceae bacterium]|nr:SdpI family protein [Oscillospiraceae bacterium]